MCNVKAVTHTDVLTGNYHPTQRPSQLYGNDTACFNPFFWFYSLRL